MTNSIDFLNKTVTVVMDRPMGSKHHKVGFIYPVNYGYIPNTVSGDGEEIDVYVVGVDKPIKTIEAKVIAVIRRLNDNEDKLVACPVSCKEKYTKQQIIDLTYFQEKYFKSEVYIAVFCAIVITMYTLISYVKTIFSEHRKVYKQEIACIR